MSNPFNSLFSFIFPPVNPQRDDKAPPIIRRNDIPFSVIEARVKNDISKGSHWTGTGYYITGTKFQDSTISFSGTIIGLD